MLFFQWLLYYFLSCYGWLWLLSFFLFVIIVMLSIKRKKLHRMAFCVCSVVVVLCFGVFMNERLDGRFWDYKNYGVVEGVFLETNDGQSFVFNKDDILKAGSHSGWVSCSGRWIDFNCVDDLSINRLDLYGDFDLKSGDCVSMLVKNSIDSPLTRVFHQQHVYESFVPINFDVDEWSPVFIIKTGQLSADELNSCVLDMENSFYLSGRTMYGDVIQIGSVPTDIMWSD